VFLTYFLGWPISPAALERKPKNAFIMIDSHESTRSSLAAAPVGESLVNQAIVPGKFWLAAGILLAAFCVPLWGVGRFALHSELYSYILLVPVVSVGLVWLDRDRLAVSGVAAPAALGVLLLALGGALLAWYGYDVFVDGQLERQDQLALSMYAFAALFAGICCLFVDRGILRRTVFPLCFLVFLAPFPIVIEQALEKFLQYASSDVAYAMFVTARMPTFRAGTFFQLPGFALIVAPECSGIHSTVALFITSLVAGQVLLRSRWKRAVLAAAVLPIALLRNGFRVFVIGELCVHVSPDMINSYIHRHGGPIFFVLSLIPFSFLLLWLLRSERARPTSVPARTP
jgi:exosortase C (VPDSG-CTERM-specific)